MAGSVDRYLIRYKMAGGSWRVAHVHTPEGIDAWNELAQTPGFEISCGFKPFVAAIKPIDYLEQMRTPTE